MLSRSHEDYDRLPASELRGQHRLDMGSDPYRNTPCDTRDRSPYLRRSSSPGRLDGSRWASGVDRRRGNAESRDYHLSGGRNDKTPSYQHARKRPQLEEGVAQQDYREFSELRQRHELIETRSHIVNTESLNGRHIYQYQHKDSGLNKEKEIIDSRMLASGVHRMGDQKSVAMEDGTVIGSYRFPPSTGHTSNYTEPGEHLISSRSSVQRIDHETFRYRDPMVSNKFPVIDSRKDEERTIFGSRDVLYPKVPELHSKEFASSSSGSLRSRFLDSYRESQHWPPSDEFSRTCGELADPIGLNAYGQRPLVGSAIEPEEGKMSPTCYQQGVCSPRTEHDDYLCSKTRAHGYLSREMNKMIHPYAHLDYDDTIIEPDRGGLSRSRIMDRLNDNDDSHEVLSEPMVWDRPISQKEIVSDNKRSRIMGRCKNTEDSHENPREAIAWDYIDSQKQAVSDHKRSRIMDRLKNAEDSHGNPREGIVWDYPASQKLVVSDYLDMGRTTEAIQQDVEYLGAVGTHAEMENRVPRNYEFSEREVGWFFPVSKCDPKIHRNSEIILRKDEELGRYELSERVHKGKYASEQEFSSLKYRTNILQKYSAAGEIQGQYDNAEEWIDDDKSGPHKSRTTRYDHNEYKKSKRTYLDRGISASDDIFSSQKYSDYAQKHPVEPYKHGARYMKGHSKHGPVNWYSSHNVSKKYSLHKQHKDWKRNEDYCEYVHENDDHPSEDWPSRGGSEPTEDSEEFKQLVNKAFLKYSKQLNMKHGVRKRYKEQGKAGSLYCIVCGISFSKEFTDTQRLATHAFMSLKVGLRAKHLGLHKAICVLLGWNILVPRNTKTWLPEVLPKKEALAQKEDLILWPPLIIIRNITLSGNNPDKWKLITIEALEAFLRSKGFSGGRIKVCLGRPADQSIMVGKFLGTFSGLSDAERLHNYFAEKKHGRVDFERLKGNNENSTIDAREVNLDEEKIEEKILYGYMGTVEDFDDVDFRTREWSMIKSKSEIQELATAPIKTDET